MATDFELQVQEWNRLLLRGADPAKMEQYWGAFQVVENKIQAEGKAVLPKLNSAMVAEKLNSFLVAHKRAGEEYRKGLAAFKQS